MAEVTPNLDARLAHQSFIYQQVKAVGVGIEARAKARLGEHHTDHPESKIVAHRESTDYVIELIDEAAASIEFGREAGTTESGRHYGAMEGLHILRDAI